MAEIKTKVTKSSVTAFIRKIEDPIRQADAKALLKLFAEVTGEKPKLWGTSIIGYGQYHYQSDRSTQEGDWPLTGFSPRKSALTLYIMPGFREYGEFLKDLGKHKISSGSCVYIKRLSDIHLPTLKKLIRQSVTDMRRRYKG